MRISRYSVLFLLALFLIMNYGCESEKPSESNVVATYDGNNKVTISELNKYVEDWLYFKKFSNRSDSYNNALNDLLVNQFKRMDFFDKGLDKDSSLVQHINRIINEELVTEYFETQYVDKYANEEFAKKIYGIMDKEVIYRSISLNIPENATPKQFDTLKEKALVIKSEIDNGKDFSSIVKEYSQYKISFINNGYMPPVDWKQSISDPVGDIIFRLNKNDVRVLNSNDAIMIVKIADINKIHVEPFDSIKNKIILELKQGFANTTLDEYEIDKRKLVDVNSLNWNKNALKQIVQWSNNLNFYRSGQYKNTFKNALENGNNKIVLTYNRGTVDYKELLRLLDNILIIGRSNNVDEDYIKKYILEALRTELIVKKANSLDLKKNIFHPFTTNQALKNQIVYLYNQTEVEAKIPGTTDDALHRFFQKNENTLYYQLEKRNLFVMVFPTEMDAEKVSAKIKSEIPFEKVTGNYLVKTYIKERNGEIKSYLSDEKPTFDKVAFEMKESEVSGPIKFEDENDQLKYAIIKCYHIRPEKQLIFSDVKNSITEDFKNYHRKKIEKEIEGRLKSKYHPVINEEVLVKIISFN